MRYDRSTGLGRVRPRDGQYADALRKGSRVHLAHAESSGALSPTLTDFIDACYRRLKRSKLADTTIYGTSRTSTKKFRPHHTSAMSAAIVYADARQIDAEARRLNRRAALGVRVGATCRRAGAAAGSRRWSLHPAVAQQRSLAPSNGTP